MESLLHWDFSPGLAIESQVRAKFGSTVHFSRANPGSSKEFFLVVSFSSASFKLTEESVALALQSCIGGLASRFRVLQLSDRRFRFSVASNRVGHFIYGLKDRIWPDFICHFHLFHGVPDHAGVHHEVGWHADSFLHEVGSRSLAIKSKWLQDQQSKFDQLNSVAQHLAPSHDDTQSSSPELSRPPAIEGIFFGQFNFPVISDQEGNIRLGDFVCSGKENVHVMPSFKGSRFRDSYWDSISDEKLYHIMDGWQAGYSNTEVASMVQIADVPSQDYIDSHLLKCSKCSRHGHPTTDCPGIFCQRCIRLIYQCLCPEYLPDRGEACMLGRKLQTYLACNSREHISRSCPGLQRCSSCNLLGHVTCRGGWIGPAYYWRPKTFKLTTPPLVERKDIGCQGGRWDKHGNNQGLLWKVK